MKKIILSYLALLFALSLSAQTSNALYAPFIHQANVFPQEKTYVCTDANCYQAGQRISLRVFVVNAITHQPTDIQSVLPFDASAFCKTNKRLQVISTYPITLPKGVISCAPTPVI